jgi:hypothetical protein
VSLLTSSPGGLEPSTVVAMLVGGVLAAPVAAWSVKFVPARLLGVLVAGLLLLTNFRELATWAELGVIRWAGYAAIVGAVVLAADPRVPWRTAPADNADLRPTAGS